MGLAIGAEPREPRVRAARLAAGGRFGDGQGRVSAALLALGELGQGRPAGPRRGHREAAGDDLRLGTE